MNPLDKARIGKTDLHVTRLGLGCSGLARSETVEQAAHTFRTAMAQGINYIDTAPLYGLGSSEERLGIVLPEARARARRWGGCYVPRNGSGEAPLLS